MQLIGLKRVSFHYLITKVQQKDDNKSDGASPISNISYSCRLNVIKTATVWSYRDYSNVTKPSRKASME